jgi:hypothetical protein
VPVTSTNLSKELTTVDTRMLMPDGSIVDLAAEPEPLNYTSDRDWGSVLRADEQQQHPDDRLGYLAPAPSDDTLAMLARPTRLARGGVPAGPPRRNGLDRLRVVLRDEQRQHTDGVAGQDTCVCCASPG